MNIKKFIMRDDEFLCENCLKPVEPLRKTARDHCPYCLFSKHLDIFPGDRRNNCQGLLKPIAVEKFKKTYKIIYRCDDCGAIVKNIMAPDDNFDEILRIMKTPVRY